MISFRDSSLYIASLHTRRQRYAQCAKELTWIINIMSISCDTASTPNVHTERFVVVPTGARLFIPDHLSTMSLYIYICILLSACFVTFKYRKNRHVHSFSYSFECIFNISDKTNEMRFILHTIYTLCVQLLMKPCYKSLDFQNDVKLWIKTYAYTQVGTLHIRLLVETVISVQTKWSYAAVALIDESSDTGTFKIQYGHYRQSSISFWLSCRLFQTSTT